MTAHAWMLLAVYGVVLTVLSRSARAASSPA